MAKRQAAAQDWTRGRIRYELEKVGIRSLYDLDRRHGLPLGTASNTLSEPHVDGERYLAAALGLHPSKIWPSRYDARGRRLSPQPPANYRRGRDASPCQNGAPA